MKKICLNCKKEYEKPYTMSIKNWFTRNKFCSQPCRGKFQHNAFKGDGSKYIPLHQWLSRNYGKADYCENLNGEISGIKCKQITKKFHWAKLNDKKYEYKRENFIKLCQSCHHLYDYAFDGHIVWNKGKKATLEMIEKNRLGHLGQISWNKGLKMKQLV